MSAGLRIKQVAQASGFTPATLRYYEQLGLLPEPTRTAAGYRTYDQRTLDRLAFIARAKQLGCTLEEISGLTTAWDGGRCGPIQDRLRQLVSGKIAAAQEQVADLATFMSELQGAAVALERHRPEGACDAACGCVTAPAADASPIVAGEPPIACTLEAGSMKGRVADWQSLLAHVDRRVAIDDGVRWEFSASVPHDELMALVAAEQGCCQFFEFAITVDRRGVALEVRAPGDAQPIVESLFGAGDRG